MNYDPKTETIKCHGCLRILSPPKDVIQPYGTEDVLCVYCIAHLGYTHDIPQFFHTEQQAQE